MDCGESTTRSIERQDDSLKELNKRLNVLFLFYLVLVSTVSPSNGRFVWTLSRGYPSDMVRYQEGGFLGFWVVSVHVNGNTFSNDRFASSVLLCFTDKQSNVTTAAIVWWLRYELRKQKSLQNSAVNKPAQAGSIDRACYGVEVAVCITVYSQVLSCFFL